MSQAAQQIQVITQVYEISVVTKNSRGGETSDSWKVNRPDVLAQHIRQVLEQTAPGKLISIFVMECEPEEEEI